MKPKKEIDSKEQFFKKIFDEYYHSLCFYANKYVKDTDTVKDLVQDVFVLIWERKMTFPTDLALKSFLYTSVYNSCINYLKSTRIHEKHHERIRQESDETDNSNYLLDRIENEVMYELLSAIEHLPEECRKVFKLSYLEGKNIQEVADTLQISSHTVKSQRARAKQLLKERLKDLYPLLIYLFLDSIVH